MDSGAKKTNRRKESKEPAETSSKKQKRSKPDFSNPTSTVTFKVGKEGETEPFLVHKEFACYYSPVLDAAFNSDFVEGQTQTYSLEDVGASAFRILVQWLYTQHVDAPLEKYGSTERDNSEDDDGDDDDEDAPEDTQEDNSQDDADSSSGTEEGGDDEDDETSAYFQACQQQELDLVQSWVLGEKLLIPSFQNAVLKKLQALWLDEERPVCTKWLPYLYEHTNTGSQLRHLIVDQFAYVVNPASFMKHPEDLPKEMLVDITFTLCTATIPLEGEATECLDKNGRQKYACYRIWRDYLVPRDRRHVRWGS